jgi:ribosome-associated translation inhibitor RaiA
MQILINTDRNLVGGESLATSVRATVEDALQRFSGHITRVEVHLADENAGKSGNNDKRCMMEARLEGLAPIAVTEHAETVAQAIDGAAERLVRRLEHTLGRQADKRRHGEHAPTLPD